MNGRIRTPPKTNPMLSRWVDAYARKIGQDVTRVRRWVAYMALGGALERAGFHGDGPRFAIKGGVALELRLGARARATRDLDLVVNDSSIDPVAALDTALEESFEGFTFRRREDPHPLPRGGARVEVSVEYAHKGWSRIQVDLTPREGDSTEFEMVEALDLREFFFDFPERLPCLSLYVQAAQKLHAMTLPGRPGRPNERFRDLVDLLLLKELITDFAAFRESCEKVFALRAIHPWPPLIEAHEHWVAPFARMAEEMGLPVKDLHTAVYQARAFLNDVDPRTPLFREVQVPAEISATTWYYLVSASRQPIRLASGKAEALLKGDRQTALSLPASSRRDANGLVLVGIVIILRDQVASWIERVSLVPLALQDDLIGADVAIEPEYWRALATEIQRRTRAPAVARESLAKFLSTQHGSFPFHIGQTMGISARSAHAYFAQFLAQGVGTNTLWDLSRSEVVEVQIASEALAGERVDGI